MLPNLPFIALRAFEAVVRLRGFARAADELGVTQSSVSQHVKVVEEWIGRKLLVRGPRDTVATKEGKILATTIAAGIGQIADLCDKMRHKGGSDPAITVSCLPGFAVNWLFPRLIRFDQLHADTSVSISTDASPLGFATGQSDLAILYGMGNYPGLHVERLMDERLFPVCARSLLNDGPPLDELADLSRHTLLMDELADVGGSPPTWNFWAEQTGQTLPKPARIRRFGQTNMVVQAAVQGLGVALGREPLVVDALANGSLVQPLKGVALSQYSYWLVCPKNTIKSERLQRFRDWLFQEAGGEKPLQLKDF
jgi:LysR family transcriptional regulator, glycine cleavage system transcriptional activator